MGSSNPQTLSSAVAEWVVGFEVDAAPEEIRAAARKALINSVGTGVAAYRIPDVERLRALVREEEASGPATLLLSGEKAPLALALLPNTALFNNLTQEETHIDSVTHPSESSVPVLLGLGERLGSGGDELLEALIVAVEVTVALAMMELTPPVKVDNVFSPAVYGTIGAAAGAAKLAGLDATQTAHALGLAACFTAGLSECVQTGTSEYHFEVPHSAFAGYTAYNLASRGGESAPTAFEGHAGFYQLFGAVDREALAAHDVVGDVLGRLGSEWGITELIYKPWPVYFFNQSLVDGARRIRESEGFDPGAIEAVKVTIGTVAAASGGFNEPPYKDRDNVLGSSGFCVDSMLLRGSLGLSDTEDTEAEDILGLLRRTEVIGDEEAMTAKIEVRSGGREFRYDGDAEGRDWRLPEAEVEDIYREAAANTYGDEQSERVLGMLREIESLGDVGDLVAAMTLEGEAA